LFHFIDPGDKDGAIAFDLFSRSHADILNKHAALAFLCLIPQISAEIF